MVGRGLKGRVEALEGAGGEYGRVTRWHWLLQKLGETAEESRERYEATNGPIGPTEGIIRWKMVKPPCHA